MTARITDSELMVERWESAAATNAFITVTAERGHPLVAVKDLIDVAGLPTTAGGPLAGIPDASRDAPAIANLRAEGAAIIGKTNLYEWAYGVSSVNRAHGPVRNPHDPERSAGGSSSGSAAAVAAGLCDWAVGTDTAGSVRLPASLCGVVGYKPSHGMISTQGVVPLSPSQDVVGVLAPDVATAGSGGSILAGHDLPRRDVNTNAGAPRLVVPEDWVRDLDEETAAAWARYASHLPERLLAPRAQIFDNAVTLQAYEANAIHAKALRENPSRFNPDVQERLRFGSTIEGAAAAAAANSLSRLAGDIDSRLSPGELIALPTTACVAPRLDEPDPREPLTRFTRPFSGTGHPAISIPLPSTGMPVGIQLVARRGDDAWLIEGAAAVEQLLSNGDVL